MELKLGFVKGNACDGSARCAVDGKAVNHTHVAGAVGSDGEGILGNVYFGDVGDVFLVLHRGKVEFRVLELVELAARGGVCRDVQHLPLGGIRDAVGHAPFRDDRGQAVHHVAACVRVVVTHQYHIYAQLGQQGREFCAALKDVIVKGMVGHTEYRLVEHDDLPIGLVAVGLQRVFQELLVLGCAEVVGVEAHDQHIVVHEPVIAARGGVALILYGVGHGKMLLEYRAAAVVIPDCHRQGQRREIACGQELAVLRFAFRVMYLIPQSQHKTGVGEIFAHLVKRVLPAVLVVFNVPARADLRVSAEEEGEVVEAAGFKGSQLGPARGITADAVRIFRVFRQAIQRCTEQAHAL